MSNSTAKLNWEQVQPPSTHPIAKNFIVGERHFPSKPSNYICANVTVVQALLEVLEVRKAKNSLSRRKNCDGE